MLLTRCFTGWMRRHGKLGGILFACCVGLHVPAHQRMWPSLFLTHCHGSLFRTSLAVLLFVAALVIGLAMQMRHFRAVCGAMCLPISPARDGTSDGSFRLLHRLVVNRFGQPLDALVARVLLIGLVASAVVVRRAAASIDAAPSGAMSGVSLYAVA
jgi:hypothetical protein